MFKKLITKDWWKKNYKRIIVDSLIVMFVGTVLIVSGLLIWVSTLEIPDLSSFEDRRILQSTKIYDRTGEILLYDLHQDVKRTIVPYENISRNIKNATIAIEDERFYSHFGIDLKSIVRAAVVNTTAGDLLGGQGGSTITQQVIKNSVLQRDKKLSRKVKEAILSIKLERTLSKDEILSIYLNESPYGGTIYGVEEASQSFFGKKASDVTLAEAAYLASLPQAPTYLSPYGNNKEDLDARKNVTLRKMLENQLISADEYNQAKDEVVTFLPQAISGIRAPHFVMFVREQLVKQYGEEALAERGFKVITTLNYEFQEKAEKIVAEKAAINKERFKADNAGLVAVDPKNGDVLTMVGSKDYFSEEIDGNFNIALAERQPGSAIKPFIYAAAFSKGYLPNTILFDVKTQFSPLCPPDSTSSESPCYSPNNYNGKFLGPISMRNAMAQSLNIPAVKTLYLAGIKNSLKLAADMGLTTLNDPERYGLTLVLGGGEVRLLDMTHAFGVFANEGVRAEPRSVLKIEDSQGNLVFESQVASKRVLDRNVALMISDVLTDNVARTPLWGANSLVNFTTRDVASKTGSTNNLRDAWLMGYTPNLAVGTWVGNNNNAPMGGGLSGLIVTPMWREFFDFALEKIPDEKFAQPQIDLAGVKPIIRGDYIDSSILISQAQTGSTTPDISGVINSIHDILYYVDKNDPQGPYPSNPNVDDQFANWEYGVQAWKNATYGAILAASVASSTAETVTPDEETEEEEETPRRRRNNRDD
ncbi:MAG: transglycosylase domain-containing protein [Patescibacteria group bacterium]